MLPFVTHRLLLKQQQLLSLLLLILSSCVATATATAASSNGLRYIPKSEFPTDKQHDWISLDPKTEFLSTTNDVALNNMARQLSGFSNSNSPYNTQPFANGVADYNSYQQAWRLLGFMIDCDAINTSAGGSGDKNNGRELTGEGCQRYVVWAAYVDLDYQGGGIGEYQYWDRDKKDWDTTSCNYVKTKNKNNNDNENYNRCAKMDCHLEDTHWSMLGFFKHKSYSDWFGQLFKHEGMCIWSSDEYSFMKNAKKAWPSGCTLTGKYINSDTSKPLYYDLKPTQGGGITVGLYTDTKCVQEYQNQGFYDQNTVENVVGNYLMNNQGGHSRDNNQNQQTQYSLSEAKSMWDNYFDIFTICQPCVAYDLDNVGYNTDDDASKGSAYGTYRYGYEDEWSYYYYGSKGADFDCYDDAGYTNVNQCMKFMAKTTMETTTYRDLALATTQGTFVDNPVSTFHKYISYAESNTPGSRVQKAKGVFMTCCFFILSSVVMAIGMFSFSNARKTIRDDDGSAQFSLSNPLVFIS